MNSPPYCLFVFKNMTNICGMLSLTWPGDPMTIGVNSLTLAAFTQSYLSVSNQHAICQYNHVTIQDSFLFEQHFKQPMLNALSEVS